MKKNVKYISLIPILLIIFLVILGIIFNQSLVGISLFGILILITSVASIIICISLHHRKIKSMLVYIILVVSIIINLSNILFFINDIQDKIRKNNNFDSEKYYIEAAKALEESLTQSAKYYYKPSYYFENTNLDKIVISKNQSENEFNEKWFKLKKEDLGNCDGYIVININQDYINYTIERYKRNMGVSDYSSENVADYDDSRVIDTLKINSFINCNGKYTYKTIGYDESQILSE